jgi:hypothetical protein
MKIFCHKKRKNNFQGTNETPRSKLRGILAKANKYLLRDFPSRFTTIEIPQKSPEPLKE